jgi:hypothetical protein
MSFPIPGFRRLPRVMPETEIWRVVNLMFKRYSDARVASEDGPTSSRKMVPPPARGFGVGAWTRSGQLANTTPPGRLGSGVLSLSCQEGARRECVDANDIPMR